MNDVHRHAHGGRLNVHASVDRLTNDFTNGARLGIHPDSALMQKLGVAAELGLQ